MGWTEIDDVNLRGKSEKNCMKRTTHPRKINASRCMQLNFLKGERNEKTRESLFKGEVELHNKCRRLLSRVSTFR